MHPIEPPPNTKALSPGCTAVRCTPCTTQARGSAIAAREAGTLSEISNAARAGTRQRAARPPSR